MNYQILARKWRPKKFSDVVGQQHIMKVIANSFSLKKIHHAYMFTGMRGIGKTTIARLFAKGLNCEKDITFDVCDECTNCKDINSNCFIDLIEIDAASRTKVEEIRELLDNVQYSPSQGRFKIYLIDEVHMLSKYSFNALLKTLEEPPAHVKFILVTTEHRKLPETILSRCLQFYLKPLNVVQMIEKLTYILKEENIFTTKSALQSLVRASSGSMRDALNLIEQAAILGEKKITDNIVNDMFGVLNVEHALCLTESLIYNDIHNIFFQIHKYSNLGVNWNYILTEMLIFFKKIAVKQFVLNTYQTEDNNAIPDIENKLIALTKIITPEQIQLYYQILLLGLKELSYTPNPRIGMEMIMLRASIFQPIVNLNNNTQNNTSLNNAPLLSDVHLNDDVVSSHIDNCTILNNQINTACHSFPRILEEKDVCKKNNLHDKKTYNVDTNIQSNTMINKNTTVDTTSKLLAACSLLEQRKKSYQLSHMQKSKSLNKENLKNLENMLQRFSRIDSDSCEKSSKIQDFNVITNENDVLIHKINTILNNNVNSNTIKDILKKFAIYDPWILKIYKFPLDKNIKTLIMNSWRENISHNEICLHVRSNFNYLNSQETHKIIEDVFSKISDKSIILNIKENNDFSIKTPIEYILHLYKEQMSKIKKNFNEDPNIQAIKRLFDISFNEKDITLI